LSHPSLQLEDTRAFLAFHNALSTETDLLIRIGAWAEFCPVVADGKSVLWTDLIQGIDDPEAAYRQLSREAKNSGYKFLVANRGESNETVTMKAKIASAIRP
jgi:hypothetical protein